MARLAAERKAASLGMPPMPPMPPLPTKSTPVVASPMTTVREAFRQRRLAQQKRHLWMFYLEHNLFEEARDSRQMMIEHLRSACRQWRLTLGTAR